MASKTGERDQQGRFKPGVSGNPNGRPKSADELRRLLSGHAEPVAKKVIEAAQGGDMQACRIVMERLLPAVRPAHAPVEFDIDPDAPLADQGKAVMVAIAAGQIPADQGKALLDGLSSLARVIEIDEIAARMEKIQEAIDNGALANH